MVSTLVPEAPTVRPPEKSPVPKPVEKPKPIGPAEENVVAVIASMGGENASDSAMVLEAIAETSSETEPKQDASTAQPKTDQVAGVEKSTVDESEPDVSNAQIKVDQSEVNLAKIKALSEVGPEKYGLSLVEINHNSLPDGDAAAHEAAQAIAYNEALPQMIEAGLVDPSQIGTEIVTTLGVSAEVDLRLKTTHEDIETHEQTITYEEIATHEQIPTLVSQELDDIVLRKLITQEEADVIMQEVETFSALYHEAYPDATVAQAFELVRNNARTLAYQTNRDKAVFSGSDHGIKHILQGNMKFADQMIEDLIKLGVPVTPKDKILIRQTIIDHDCGYTCGCARAVTPSQEADGTETKNPGFKASKDHPLFSAKFVEANKDYYVRMFGEEGYDVIQTSILNHSYPTELPQQLDPASTIHKDLVRSISSTVDSLGVTAETKTPVFFTKPEAVRVLLKVKLAMETVGEEKDGKVIIPKDLMKGFKEELTLIAGTEGNVTRRADFISAIDNFFSEFTADTTLGHFTGVVDGVRVVRTPNPDGTPNPTGRLTTQIDMHMSQIHALLGNMFGGKIEKQAFDKAMKDFGMTQANRDRLGAVLAESRASGQPVTPDRLTFVGPNGATFVVSPELADYAMIEFAEIQMVMSEVNVISIRSEINRAIAESEGKGVEEMGRVLHKFQATISEKTTAAEVVELSALVEKLADTSPSGDIDGEGQPITVAQKAKTELKRFLSQREKEFLNETDVGS